jgi:hypothetical protein
VAQYGRLALSTGGIQPQSCVAQNTIACDSIMRRPYATGDISCCLWTPTSWAQWPGKLLSLSRKRLMREMQPRNA